MAKNRDLSKLANRLTVDSNYNVGISGSLSITGSLIATGTTLVSSSAQILSGTTIHSGSFFNGITVVSGSGQISYTGITNIPSGIVSSSTQVTNYGFANTGSNTFQGTQTVNGSLVITGSITAQQYIVSSSVTYLTESFASGSHKFGDSSDDIHQFTGSLYITGAAIMTYAQITSTGSDARIYSFSNDAAGSSAGFTAQSTAANGGFHLISPVSGAMSHVNTVSNYDTYLSTRNANNLILATANTERIRIGGSGGTSVTGSLNITGSVGIYSTPISGSLQIGTPGNNGTNNICLTGGSAYPNTYIGSFGGTTYINNNYYYLSGHRSDDATKRSMELSMDQDMVFVNTMPAGSPGTRTRILTVSGSAGFVGINTSTPADVIDVRRNQNATTNFYFRNTDTTDVSSRAYLNVIAGNTTLSLLALHSGDTYIAGTSGRNMIFQQNPSGTVNMYISGSGYVGINDTAPSKRLTVNFGTNVSDGIMVTGSQRQESRFKSTGEHSNLVIDSAHSNIYLPTIGLERNSTRLAEIRLQRASSADTYSSFAESEMVIGTTTQTPTSLQMNGSRKLVIDTNGNTNIIGTAIINGALSVANNGFNLKSWKQYTVALSAGGSTNTGAIIFRQFQDSVNWNTGNVIVEIINYSYANSEYDTRKDMARYGYSNNAAAVNVISGNITGKIPQPYWGSAIQGSGNYYYRDLMIDISPYHAYTIKLTTAMSLNDNTTVGNGSIYLFS